MSRARPGRCGPTLGLLAGVALLAGSAAAAAAESSNDAVKELSGLSLAELSRVEVTSVSKTAQTLSRAPAAVYVITREEILRAGVHSIPEALRLAPNLDVAQSTSSSYAISSRGFIGNPQAQSYANKLLILIDGRSVYSPLFSGVFYDELEVLMEDVDRIEVISGPGATLWGANAVNGVINIITRSAQETEGTLVRASAGNQEQTLAARYGEQASDALSYRLYATGFERGSLELADGSSALDHWSKAQAGFRSDWHQGQDSLTVQGDAYHGTEDQYGAPGVPISGANVLGRWQRTTAQSSWQLQAYFDHTEAGQPLNGAGFVLNTYDVELQQTIRAWSSFDLIWGVGERLNDYHIENSATYLFEPAHRNLNLTEGFLQGTWSVTPRLQAIAGIKTENDPYSHWSAMPNARLAWTLSPAAFVWLAASQAVRAPTPFDTDVMEKIGSVVFLTGNPNFGREKLTAYELGWRGQASDWMTLSASLFYNVYSDLRSVEPAPQNMLPLYWGNLIEGDTYGLEAWANFQITSWWRLSPGVRLFHERLHFSPSASALLPLSQVADDPASNSSLKSAMNFGRRFTFDAILRHVAVLPDPYVPAYYELNARLGWQVNNALQVAVNGMNLLHSRHQEFADGEFIERSGSLEVRWSFSSARLRKSPFPP